jgi:hypothetical protein
MSQMSNGPSFPQSADGTPRFTNTESSLSFRIPPPSAGSVVWLDIRNGSQEQSSRILPDDIVEIQAIEYDLFDLRKPSQPISQVHRNESIEIQAFGGDTTWSMKVPVPYGSLPINIENFSFIYHHDDRSIRNFKALAKRPQTLEARATAWDVNCVSESWKEFVTSVGPGAKITVRQGPEEDSSENPQERQGRMGVSTQTVGTFGGVVRP